MLRDSRTADRQLPGQLINSERAVGQLLEDGHAGLVGKGVESGL
jgi:hypothetical protein